MNSDNINDYNSNTSSSSSPAPGVIEVHDFDVLADELPGTVYVMDDYEKQIGNNRFEVLIQMYQEGYNIHYTKNNMEECDRIVQKIVDVTCHKQSVSTHNQGRFLVKAMQELHWRQLTQAQSMEFVKQQLRATTIDETQDPDPFADTDVDDDLFIANNVNVTDGYAGPPDDNQDTLEPLPVSSNIDLRSSDVRSLNFSNMELNDKKRGRRSSLLRRSVSESTLMDDKKKTFKNVSGELSLRSTDSSNNPSLSAFPAPLPPGQLQRYNTVSNSDPSTRPIPSRRYRPRVHVRSPIRSNSDAGPTATSTTTNTNTNRSPVRSPVRSTTATTAAATTVKATTLTTGGTIVPTYMGMDVVLSSDCKSLSRKLDIVGNNRLKVMLSLQSRQYSQLPSHQQAKMAVDLVKAITVYWKGRILADKEFSYVILTPNESIDAMRHLLTPVADTYATSRTTTTTSTTATSATSTTTSNDLAASDKNRNYDDDDNNNNNMGSSSQLSPYAKMKTHAKTTLLSAAPPVPDFLRNASREILESGKNPHHLLGPEQMQSAAIRSIKERAGKRQMAKESSGGGCGGSSNTNNAPTGAAGATNTDKS